MRYSPSGLCALATASILFSSSTINIVDAAIVDAGALTGVSVNAPYFDNETGECGSAGCYGELTRDGDSTTPESRWSCKPDLGPSGSVCSIAYTLGEPLNLQTLHIALYNGDTRTRTLDIFIDDTLYATWTSSGTTADFEAIDLSGETGSVVELQGVLADSEWLSITEVEILVDSDVVEAGVLGTVEASAALYETDLAEDGGCDPSGCAASLTRDGDFTEGSRWSCATELGGANAECAISYNMGAVRDLSALRLALLKGNERTRTMQIKVDGVLVTTWTSSGITTGLERIDLAGASGQVLEVVAVVSSSSEYLSIIETEIMVQEDDDGTTPTPTPSTVPTTRTTDDGQLIVEAGELGWVEIPDQDRTLSEFGCGVLGCVEENTRDGSLEADDRWSCEYDSREDDDRTYLDSRCRVTYTLPYSVELHSLRIAFYEGDSETVSLLVLVDGTTVVDDWTSSGTTLDFQTISLAGSYGQSIQLIADSLENGDFLDITEVAIDVIVDDVPLLGVSASERIDVGVSTSSLDGLPVLDGDITAASSWACSSSGSDSCSITIDLQSTESVEQISMAFVDDGDISDNNVFDVSIGYSADGPFTTVLADIPSNKDRSETLQQFKMSSLARYVKIEASSLGSGSLHICEIDVRISEYVHDHAVATDASLDKVGLIPMADGSGDSRSEDEGGCSTRGGCASFYAKDGDLDTFWRCYTNNQATPDSSQICDLRFNLAYFRHLKQIRIALVDGAERASNLIFEATTPYRLNGEFDTTVISSGTTADFETYEFDHFVKSVTISGLFRNIGESISISGVEFLEEPYEDGVVPVRSFSTPYSGGEAQPTVGFGWGSSSVSGTSDVGFILSTYASVTAIELKFPVGESYSFDIDVYDETDTATTLEGFVSADQEDFQSFSLDLPDGFVVQEIEVIMKGTAGGGSSFYLLDARIIGSAVDNPTTTYTVGSTAIEDWDYTGGYPDFVAEGTGDQKAIMEAICTIKHATFDGVDCVGGDEDATGTVDLIVVEHVQIDTGCVSEIIWSQGLFYQVLLPMGEYFLDGNVFMKSGVFLNGRFSGDDSPYTTDFILEEGAAGNTDIPALVVFDGVVNAQMDDIWVYGHYDPDTDNSISAVPGLGSMGMQITNSEANTCDDPQTAPLARFLHYYCQNITAEDFEAQYIDGDAVVVTNSKWIEIDAGPFDDEYTPWSISDSRGTGVVLDNCDSVYIRRYTIYNNGVAGLQITSSNNVTFEATIGGEDYGTTTGEGNVGSLDGQQPIEIIIEGSTLVTFNDMRVTSSNEPAITVSGDSTGVVFDNCSFNLIESGVCVIQTEDPTIVSAVDDELTLDGDCFVKV